MLARNGLILSLKLNTVVGKCNFQFSRDKKFETETFLEIILIQKIN